MNEQWVLNVKVFADRVHVRANELGLSLNKVTDIMGWSVGHLNKILKGQRRPKINHIIEIAQALQCLPAVLVAGTPLEELMVTLDQTPEWKQMQSLISELNELKVNVESYETEIQEYQKSKEKLSIENL